MTDFELMGAALDEARKAAVEAQDYRVVSIG